MLVDQRIFFNYGPWSCNRHNHQVMELPPKKQTKRKRQLKGKKPCKAGKRTGIKTNIYFLKTSYRFQLSSPVLSLNASMCCAACCSISRCLKKWNRPQVSIIQTGKSQKYTWGHEIGSNVLGFAVTIRTLLSPPKKNDTICSKKYNTSVLCVFKIFLSPHKYSSLHIYTSSEHCHCGCCGCLFFSLHAFGA